MLYSELDHCVDLRNQMKTSQMTIDDDFLAWLQRQHREGYQRLPAADGEFDIWESEQVWESIGDVVNPGDASR